MRLSNVSFVHIYLPVFHDRFLLRLCKSILKMGERSGTTSVLTTNIFPRNSRATFRSSYSVGNFWGTCRKICGRKIFFDYFERFDRFNRLAVVGSGIHLIFYSDLYID